jgi:hypothetical protein
LTTASLSAQAARYQGLANLASGMTAGQKADAARYSGQATLLGASREPSADALASFIRQGVTSSKPAAPAYVPGGGVTSITTNPGGPVAQFEPDPYPTVLPSLSASQLGQLAERRRLADERLKRAETESVRRRGLLEASSERARQDADRVSRRSLQDFMREAGGKGLARSPMVAGRQVRRTGEDLRLAYGEIDTRLSTEILALQDMVSQAENERNSMIAAIEQERVNMQADLERLFPAASMFR